MFTKKSTFFILIIVGIIFAIETNAQSRLYPTNSRYIIANYIAKIDSLLLNNKEFDSFAFTIRPSFAGPQGCYYDYDSSELVLRSANESLRNSNKIEIKEYRCKISRNTARKIEKLFHAAIFSSSYLAQPNGLDGVTYEILINHGYYTAEFWSPKTDTNCYKLEEILKQLVSASIENNRTAVEDIIPKAVELTKEFEKLYPEDVKE